MEILLTSSSREESRVGIVTPKIEVRFEHFSVEGDAYVGTRALPTLVNVAVSKIEGLLGFFRLFSSKKRVVNILHDVSGIVKPMRYTQFPSTIFCFRPLVFLLRIPRYSKPKIKKTPP
ncbi:pleiotropic drug resistance protein [Salix suchowensis]|nr:pleiotropic drug resistance protein [Salix suchowensis]